MEHNEENQQPSRISREKLKNMNMRTITFTAGLLIGSGILAQSKQLSFGADLMFPQGDFGKEFSMAVGPTVGFELPLGGKLGLTIQAGYDILMLKDEEVKEFLDGASVIPAQAGLKYYFSENQSGLYLHGQAGMHSFSEKFKELPAPFEREAETETTTSFSWAIGAGYQLSKFDLGVRYNSFSIEEEEANGEKGTEAMSYIGLRVAYILSLGGK